MKTEGEKSAEEIPSQIDHYEVEGELARGGMGVVYAAFEPSLGRKVALKLVNKNLVKDKNVLARFDQEARAAADLKHANVVSIYFRGTFDGAPYFAMELVEGESLADVVRKGPLQAEQAIDYLLQTCRGLQAADEKGLIHRDIKPANLMVTGRGEIKITDFGLAKALEGDADLTHSGLVVGTPHYMSPEQAQGRELDCRSDIYSLGATFYHLLCGKRPFEKASITGVLLAHVNEELPPLKDKCPTVPAPLCATIEKMMAKRPHQRFSDYRALISHVESLQQERTNAAKLDATIAATQPAISRLDDKTAHSSPKAEKSPETESNLRKTPSSVEDYKLEVEEPPIAEASKALMFFTYCIATGCSLFLAANLLRSWNLLVSTGMVPWLYRPAFPVSLGSELAFLTVHLIPRALCLGLLFAVLTRLLRDKLEGVRRGLGAASAFGIISGVAIFATLFALLVGSGPQPILNMAMPYGESLGIILTAFCAPAIIGFFAAPTERYRLWFELLGLAALRITIDVAAISLLWRPLGFGNAVFERAYAVGGSTLAGSFLFGCCWLLLLLPISVILSRTLFHRCANCNASFLRAGLLGGLIIGYASFTEVILVSYHSPNDWFISGIGGALALVLCSWIHWKTLTVTEVTSV